MVSAASSAQTRVVRIVLACCILALVPQYSRGDDVQKHFDAGLKLYQNHKPDEALEEFQIALKGAPKDSTILRWIGFIELSRQDYDAAKEPLERAVALDPKSVVAHLNLGNVYDGLKQYTRALDEFRTVAKLKPDSADAYYNMGLVHSKTAHWPEAVEALRSAAKFDAAAAHSGGSREDPAIQDALGYALSNNGDLRGAATAYQRAVSLAPASAEFSYHLGLAWRRLAEQKKAPRETALTNARRALKTAVDRAPGNYEYAELYAEVLFDLNSNAEAAEEFARAAELDKAQYVPVYNLAIAYARTGRFADAEKAYNHALARIKPGDDVSLRRNAQNGLTHSLFRQKKYDDAIATLRTYTHDYPADTTGWVNLASAYHYKGDDTGQIEALRGAIANGASKGSVPRLRSVLGGLLYKQNDTAGALEEYTQANRARPNDSDILNGLALTEEKLGRVDDAIRDFQASAKANPRSADAFNNLGVAYESRYKSTRDKADLDRALAAYNQALAVNPRHVLARRNKERFDKAPKP